MIRAVLTLFLLVSSMAFAQVKSNSGEPAVVDGPPAEEQVGGVEQCSNCQKPANLNRSLDDCSTSLDCINPSIYLPETDNDSSPSGTEKTK